MFETKCPLTMDRLFHGHRLWRPNQQLHGPQTVATLVVGKSAIFFNTNLKQTKTDSLISLSKQTLPMLFLPQFLRHGQCDSWFHLKSEAFCVSFDHPESRAAPATPLAAYFTAPALDSVLFLYLIRVESFVLLGFAFQTPGKKHHT